MDLLSTSAANADLMFAATIQQQSQLDELSSRALTKGIDLYMDKQYKQAAQEFQRAVGLSPQGQYSSDASNYLANAYLKQGKTEKAIDAYQQSIRLNPYRDDTHVTLGNLYFSLDRFKDAEGEYRKADGANQSPKSQYSLGQVYLKLENYGAAEKAFNTVRRMDPESPNGDFGLGLTFRARGQFDEAINKFKEAITKDREFNDARTEMGFAYADLGQIEEAQGIVEFLEKNDLSFMADTLSRYMYKVDPPKFVFAQASSTFRYSLSINTPVAALDNYLSNANASKSFTMKFQFDKKMDRSSVENILNWRIGRAAGGTTGQHYNFGLSVPTTEVQVQPLPDSVYYDQKNLTATVRFTIRQNDVPDGTIDPSHIEFKFIGTDEYGLKMDPFADQFTGFSGVA
jgi:tetratricopeptide (TPR) repeat protein